MGFHTVHLVSGDLVGGVEEGDKSSGHYLMDLVLSTCVACLMSIDSDRFKGSIETYTDTS